MSKRKIFFFISVLILLSVLAFFLFRGNNKTEQIVYEDTLTISKEYLALRYKTDNVLVNAREYESYDDWNEDMALIIQEWETLESKALKLEENADEMSEETNALNFVKKAHAKDYSYAEVQAIVEKAPAGRQIRTLSQHLGVDAKMAQLILNQSQEMAARQAWGEAGDTFEKLENQAIVVKDTCKVTVYVGGIVATGGAAGFAAAGTVAQVTTVVVGVDLALEVTEDSAKIALGDRNKVSSFVKDVRTVTEPIASVLTITNIPSNLGSAYGKFDSVMVGLEQFRDTVQEGKVIGIDLKNFEYHPPFQVIKNTQYPGDITVAQMEMAEVEEWIKSINKDYKPMTKEEVQEFIASTNKETESTETVAKKEVTKNEKENNVEQTDEGKGEIGESPSNEIKLMPVEEFEELFGDFKIENISEVKEIFGEPDVVNTLDDGYGNYIYHRRLVYPNGNIAGMMIRFQNQDVAGYSIIMEEYQ